MISKNIYQYIQLQAERSPEAVALLAPDRTPLTYRRLCEHVESIRAQLGALGIRRGDRVALVLPNGPEMALAFLAVASCATVAPLNPAYQTPEFDFYLSDLAARILIVPSASSSPAIAVAQARGMQVIELSPVVGAEAGIFQLHGEKSTATDHIPVAQPDDIALILHTSGTTSRAKIVPLTHTHLCTSAQHVKSTLHLCASDRSLSVMPLFHVHGLVASLLASLMAGASVVCTPGFYAPQFFEWANTFQPTWYTAVPSMHQAILTYAARLGNATISSLRCIRSCSSSLAPQVMAKLEEVFQVPVVEAYGMTEAAHQIACNPLPPAQRKASSVGLAVGCERAILDEEGNMVPPGTKGEIVIRGANVMQGYENNPAANEKCFINGWFRTGDQGFLDADGYLFITGRLKEMINRGGEKITPREVDEVLLSHPAVAQAVAFAVPDEKLGEEIAAAVVLREDCCATTRDIREFASIRLAAFKVPKQVLIVTDIPKGPTGKLQRIKLATLLGLESLDQQQHTTRVFVAPRTSLEAQLADIWSQVLKLEKVGIHEDFFELGGDSLLATQIITRMRAALQRDVSLTTFFDSPTIADLALVADQN